MTPRLGIVLVNWKGAADTIECLESVLRSAVRARVVVVDNASPDGSAEQIVGWAAGTVAPGIAAPTMAAFTTPPLPKPLACRRLSAAEAVASDPSDPAGVTLIDAGGNLGFAGGNNLGLRHLFRDPAIDYVWLLNNDTVVEPAAAGALIARMDATFRVGMCGTIVRYYHRPDRIQALCGSRFNPLTGQSSGIGNGQHHTDPVDAAQVARDTDFVLGASLAVSRGFVETVGLMAEHYFLYYEEVDWAYRNRGRFTTAFARGAVVFHKEGGSIGSSHKRGERSTTSEYYLLRSRLAFVRRHAPLLLPLHWVLAAGQIVRRFLRGHSTKALVMTRALLGMRYSRDSRG